MYHQARNALGALLTTLLLASCGGGGESADTSNFLPGAVASSVTISNAPSLAAQGYTAMNGLGSHSDGGNLFVTGVSVSPGQISLVDATLGLLYKAPAIEGNVAAGVTYSEPCAQGGSISITETATFISITANNCREGGLRMNGTLSVTLSNLVGTPGPTTAWSGTLAISYQQLTLENSSVGVRVNGGMTMNYSQQAGGHVASSSVSGQSLHVRLTENGTVTLNSLLQQFSFVSSYNSGVFSDTANFTYAANGSAVTATSYSLVTNSAFVRNGSAYPHTGSFTLTASNQSRLTLTALNSTQVRLDLDLDGNGTIDHTSFVNWATLDSLI